MYKNIFVTQVQGHLKQKLQKQNHKETCIWFYQSKNFYLTVNTTKLTIR